MPFSMPVISLWARPSTCEGSGLRVTAMRKSNSSVGMGKATVGLGKWSRARLHDSSTLLQKNQLDAVSMFGLRIECNLYTPLHFLFKRKKMTSDSPSQHGLIGAVGHGGVLAADAAAAAEKAATELELGHGRREGHGGGHELGVPRTRVDVPGS